MDGGCDLDFGELCRCGSELVHVTASSHCVTGNDGHTEVILEVNLGRVAEPSGARDAGTRRTGQPGEGDECDLAVARGDRLGCVLNVDDVGGATGFGGVDVRGRDTHVFGHRQRTKAGGIARTEVAVDVVETETCVGKCACGDLGVNLGDRRVGDGAQRVFVRTGDVRRSPQ